MTNKVDLAQQCEMNGSTDADDDSLNRGRKGQKPLAKWAAEIFPSRTPFTSDTCNFGIKISEKFPCIAFAVNID